MIWINFQERKTFATKKFKSKITKNENQLIKQASKEEETHEGNDVEKINKTTQKSKEEDLDSEAEIHMYVIN